ncbi:MAG: hypothetical protein IRZ16_09050 [Myxococcaceae bacterium]|nr:hypothetical protein [Myxococcaceae bacterium]
MAKRIGILAGMEADGPFFPAALIDRINRIGDGVTAELAQIDATPERFTSRYAVLVDRISHEVPFYRFHLKAAALAGVYVVNDPFWFSADDKFFGFSLAAKLGVPVPRTMLLPQRDYVPSIDKNRSLRNLVYPLDWEAIARYVGFPAILKPADGGGGRNVTKVSSIEELLVAYNDSGTAAMTLQQFIDFDDYYRCICIGKTNIRVIHYDGRNRRYLADRDWPKSLEELLVRYARTLCQALGYDQNSVEFAIKDGVPYAIDFTNPAPDMYPHHIHADNYEWCLDTFSRFCIDVAREERTLPITYAWQQYLAHLSPIAASLKEAASAAPTAVAAPPIAEQATTTRTHKGGVR